MEKGRKNMLIAAGAAFAGGVAVTLTVLALAADIPLAINEAEAVQKSWPHFFEAIKPLGAEVEYA